MAEYIATPKISEILYEEFMVPYKISAYRLAHDIDIRNLKLNNQAELERVKVL